ncbi:hypothetical protein LCGC14_1447560 [marine sediment metagenome]|uniref:Uncharacterized protein n=1 Tax=marine sediment metagenome TaxID=412755 RepID=A0A0F9LZB8_9ZZZZ
MGDFGKTLDEMDVEAFFNMRGWLKKAVETAGATVEGAGVGMGQADIDITLEGHRYNISIRPRPPLVTPKITPIRIKP